MNCCLPNSPQDAFKAGLVAYELTFCFHIPPVESHHEEGIQNVICLDKYDGIPWLREQNAKDSQQRSDHSFTATSPTQAHNHGASPLSLHSATKVFISASPDCALLSNSAQFSLNHSASLPASGSMTPFSSPAMMVPRMKMVSSGVPVTMVSQAARSWRQSSSKALRGREGPGRTCAWMALMRVWGVVLV